jgi:hypothetical protein
LPWGGSVSASGSYQHAYSSASGCDSTVTVYVTIKQPSTSVEIVSSAGAYLWHGTLYTASTNTATWIGLNTDGCDSIVTLHLTITCTPTVSTETISACGSYEWNGTNYTTSGLKSFITTNAAGCDSLASINLTINAISSDTTVATSCGMYIWDNGNHSDYMSSGTYSYTENCVTHVLQLTVNQPTFDTTVATSCGMYIWENGNHSDYMSSGTYSYTENCVTHVLQLTVNQPTLDTTVATSCGMYIWENGNHSDYMSSGTYSYTENCVTHVLQLTVNQPSSDTTIATSCGMYIWDNGNHSDYMSSGTYSYTENCVTHVLQLTVNQPTFDTTVATSCGMYIWENGNHSDYMSSGTYSYTENCVTHVLQLTVNQPSSDTTRAAICGAGMYIWPINGSDYLSAGTYSYTSNCVTHILILKNAQASSSNTRYAACSSAMPYYWNGIARTSAGTYTYTTTNANGCDSLATLVLTVSTATPGTPTAVTQTLVSNVCGARVYRYKVTKVANAIGYTWTLPTSVGGISGVVIDSGDVARDSVIKIRYSSNAASIAGDSIKVRAWSGCGNSATKGFKLSNVALAVPAAPTALTITAVAPSVCGAKVYRYAAPAITTALATGTATVAPVTGYLWSFTGLGTNAVIDSGDVNSQVIRVSYTSNAAAASGDSVRVAYTSLCGNSLNKSAKLTNVVTAVPLAPATITITAVSPSVCGAKVYRYAAPTITTALATGTATVAPVTGYLWSFTGLGTTASIDSGDVNAQVIRVSYTSNAAAVTGDSVRVAYTSLCGNSLNKSAKLTNVATAVPLAPAAITVTAISTTVCGNKQYRYSAPALTVSTATAAAASGYVWSFTNSTLGNNAHIDSGDVNSQKIVVSYTLNSAAAAEDSVKLYYSSSCGNSTTKALKLTNTLLTAPLAPASVTITLVKDSCGARIYRYAAPAPLVATATAMASNGYEWSLPTGSAVAASASLDSGVMSGADARYIRLKFTNNAAAIIGDSIRVSYTSGCGTSKAKAQKLSNVAATTLAASATLTGTTSICSIVGTSTVARYTASAVTGAVSYLWTLPSGAVIDSGSNGLKIKVRFITAGPYDSIFVQAVGTNGCAGTKKVLKLVTTGCVTLPTSRVINPVITSNEESMDVMVYPNPTTSAYQLFVKSSKLSQTVKVRIIDIQGRVLKTLTFNSNETIAFGNELKAGVYMVEVREGDKVKTVRVVKY